MAVWSAMRTLLPGQAVGSPGTSPSFVQPRARVPAGTRAHYTSAENGGMLPTLHPETASDVIIRTRAAATQH